MNRNQKIVNEKEKMSADEIYKDIRMYIESDNKERQYRIQFINDQIRVKINEETWHFGDNSLAVAAFLADSLIYSSGFRIEINMLSETVDAGYLPMLCKDFSIDNKRIDTHNSIVTFLKNQLMLLKHVRYGKQKRRKHQTKILDQKISYQRNMNQVMELG